MITALLKSLSLLRLLLSFVDPAGEPPVTPREFRGAWLATLDNIDWPSARTLSTAEQRAEIRRILDAAVDLKLNAVILQVRSAADAIYASQLEPWSIVLSGKQDQQPDPAWDPLVAWIEESHQRGIELHAWLNPCRAHVGAKPPGPTHISKTRPELVVQYDRFIWFDPGLPAAVEHILRVFEDVVRRYDIDGIHVDDYFYPYPVERNGRTLPFPDDDSWGTYVANGGQLSRDDWRRSNVHSLVRRIHEQTRRLKPGIRFGISPFGISRPGVAPGITGFDQFTGIYADPVHWLREGWCDYLAPQLYWPIDQKAQSFPVLLQTWQRDNPRGIPIWPGLFTSRIGAPEKSWGPDEIVRQIQVCRDQSPLSGQIHFSFRTLLQNREGVSARLKSSVYSEPAVVPRVSRPPQLPPPPPRLKWHPAGNRVELETAGSGSASSPTALRSIVAWSFDGQGWKLSLQPASRSIIPVASEARRLFVSVVDRWGQESERSAVEIPTGRPED